MNYEYTEAENREMAWFRALPKAELHCHLDGLRCPYVSVTAMPQLS